MDDPDFWRDVRVSATEFAIGYLAAIALAIPLGLATGWYKRAQYVIGPFVDELYGFALLEPGAAAGTFEDLVLVENGLVGTVDDHLTCRFQVLVVLVRIAHGHGAIVGQLDFVGCRRLFDRDLQHDDPVTRVGEPIATLVSVERGREIVGLIV